MNALISEESTGEVFYTGERAGRHYLPGLLRDAGLFEEESTSWCLKNSDIRHQEKQDVWGQEVVKKEESALIRRMGGVRALRYLVENIFENFNLPRRDGMDIGSGAYGFMAQTLLRDTIPGIIESDINNQVINFRWRLREVAGNFVPASYYDLRDKGVDSSCLSIVTGLSVLGDTKFPQQVIASVRDALRSGGFFLHVQDLLPSLPVAFGGLAALGEDAGAMYSVENLGTGEAPWTVDVNDRRYSALELAAANFSAAVQQVDGMKMIFNRACVAQVPSLNSRMDHVYHNGYKQVVVRDTSLPAIEQATALVTIIQKQ